LCHPVLWGIFRPFLRKNNAKLTPSFRQVLFPKKFPVLTGLTSPTFKGRFELDFLKFKNRLNKQESGISGMLDMPGFRILILQKHCPQYTES